MTAARPLTGLAARWPWRQQPDQRADLPADRVAERTESYVYGNVLVLAALATLEVADVATGRAALLVLGTAASTFVAHLLAVAVGHQAHRDSSGSAYHLRASVRDSVPIATSGLIPGVLLLAGWAGWPPSAWALGLATVATAVRLVFVGSVASYLSGEQSVWRNALVGFGLGVAGIVVATLKVLLTH